MRRLIFSDNHLTDEFDAALCNYITKLTNSVDQVIINGDFWDGYVVSFEKFVNSRWQVLFPLLKKKKTIYLYGNHDRQEFMDERVKLFSVRQLNEHQFTAGARKVIVTHGHQVAPEFDGVFPRITKKFRWLYPSIFKLSRSPSLAGRLYRSIKIRHYRYNMRRLQQYAQANFGEAELLITGHSHIQVDNRRHGFINLGEFGRGWARYALIDGSKISVREENYEKLAKSKKRR
jgi:predicted phosphodiesterase